MGRILVFLIMLGLGLLFVIKTDGVEAVTGPIGWAQRTFGGAGTNTFYKLLGILMIIIGTIALTHLDQRIIGGLLGFLFSSH